MASEHKCLAHGENVEKLVLEVGMHMQAVFAMLRYLKNEQEPRSTSRRFPRTGGFRKSMNAEDWVELNLLMGKMVVNSGRAVSPGSDFGNSSRAVSPGSDLAEVEDDDADGWPAVFAQFFRTQEAAAAPRPSPPPPSPTSTAFYSVAEQEQELWEEQEPLPALGGAGAAELSPLLEEQEPLPIVPHPKTRRLSAVAGRKKDCFDELHAINTYD